MVWIVLAFRRKKLAVRLAVKNPLPLLLLKVGLVEISRALAGRQTVNGGDECIGHEALINNVLVPIGIAPYSGRCQYALFLAICLSVWTHVATVRLSAPSRSRLCTELSGWPVRDIGI